MEIVNTVFPILLYSLGVILLFVLIMFIINLIRVVKKSEELLEEVDTNFKKIEVIFDTVDKLNDFYSSASVYINKVKPVFTSIFNRKKHVKKKRVIKKERVE